MKEAALLILLLFFLLSCKDDPPPGPNGESQLQFAAVDASCTEAWLQIKLAATAQPRTLHLRRDTTLILTFTPVADDTLIVDEGLLPNRQYTYTLTRPIGPIQERLTSSITTLDSTSHDFTWEIDTLGDGGGSVLYDVAIINDSLAYAVGEIYKRDSVGNWDPNAYNLVRWNGTTWDLLRVQFYTFCGQTGTGSYPARAVFAFSPQDVWVAMAGSQVVRWNGHTQSAPTCTPVSINKLWGSSPSNIYAVGNNGGIAHDGTTWRRLESGTGLAIMDVYGARESQSGRYEVLCVAADPAPWGRSPILAIEDSRVREVAILPWEQWCIWFVPRRYYIVGGGDGPFQAHSLDGPWLRIGELPALFQTSIDGQGFNDIIVGGAFWLLAHWNGVNWQTYFPRTNGSFVSVVIKGNLVLAVGGIYNRAVAIIGRR